MTYQDFESQFSDMLNLVESHTGQSERENVKDFLERYKQEIIDNTLNS